MNEITTFRAIRKRYRPGGRAESMPRPLRKGGGRDSLAELFCSLGCKIGVEIGTHRGKYAKVLCSGNPQLKLYCVDPWLHYSNMPRLNQDIQNAVYEEAKARLQGCNVEMIRKPSMDALSDFLDESIDFVYIDGNHDFEYAYEDIVGWSKKVKPGGIIACHDFYSIHWPGVTKAVEKYIAESGITVWYGTRDRLSSAMWVKR